MQIDPMSYVMAMADAAADPPLALIAALGMERTCIEAGASGGRSGLLVYQSGPGAERAAASARAALAAGAAGFVSWGFAAGLVADVGPGSVVVPSRVRRPDGSLLSADGPWRAALLRALGQRFTVSERDLLGVDEVLMSSNIKQAAAAASGAVAADMESAAIAAAADEAGVPFVAVRVVLDGLADGLPPGIDQWIDAAGNRRYGPLLGTLRKPASWGSLLVLASRYRAAHSVLIQIARRLVPAEFAWPHRRLPTR